jgi:hypothetical protein
LGIDTAPGVDVDFIADVHHVTEVTAEERFDLSSLRRGSSTSNTYTLPPSKSFERYGSAVFYSPRRTKPFRFMRFRLTFFGSHAKH